MNDLDRWVSCHGTKTYVPSDYTDPIRPGLEILPLFGMQQNRQEIQELVKTIVSQPWYGPRSRVLEIGLGHFGSSHVLWREMFEKVTTIEIDHRRVNRFSENIFNYHGRWILDDGRSDFVIGPSQSPESVKKVYSAMSAVDFLFIDGDHSYEGVLSDWLLYSPLVKSGGIVAFDDSMLMDGGVPMLCNQLKQGFLGRRYDIKDIAYSRSIGISFYIVS